MPRKYHLRTLEEQLADRRAEKARQDAKQAEKEAEEKRKKTNHQQKLRARKRAAAKKAKERQDAVDAKTARIKAKAENLAKRQAAEEELAKAKAAMPIESMNDPRLRDPNWRLQNLYYITNKQGLKVKFKPNAHQLKFYNNMWYLNCILKARQLGFSTFILVFMLDRCLFNSDIRAGVIAHNKDDAKVLFRDKIKFAYDNLPDWLKASREATKNDAGELLMSNNSSIRVGTSMRSGTLQYLHISEYGKICSKYPDKAKEIQSGALNAVDSGSFVFMESTAEGAHGDFHDTYKASEDRVRDGGPRTKMSYEPFFFPWWEEPGYQIEDRVPIPDRLEKYFRDLDSQHNIVLTDPQKWWYTEKRKSQGTLMMQEYPSVSDEAFNQPVEGAYFASDMIEADEDDRILNFAFDRRVPVNTFWDIGMNETDTTCIWFHQLRGSTNYFIDFHQNHSVGLDEYIRTLVERGYRYGTHFLPHDGQVREWGNNAKKRWESLADAKIGDVTTVKRAQFKNDSIDRARVVYPTCVWHKELCAEGITAIRNYRREWDEKLEVWKNKPRHDWASNPMDAFFTFTDGFEPPRKHKPLKQRSRSIATV